VQGVPRNITIIIDGLRNPYNNEASSSFQIVTFNKVNNVLYFLDQVSDGLIIRSQCAYPCKDCESSHPTQCLSCFADSALPFLQENTCLAGCSQGRYFDVEANKCLRCDRSCLTCSDSAKTCTTCGVGTNLLLRGTECVATCGKGFIDDPSRNLCQPCRDGCTACSLGVTNCTACDPLGITPLYFKFDCLEKCPA
jgi:hypothetical protein